MFNILFHRSLKYYNLTLHHIATGNNDYISFYGETLKYLVPATDDQRNLPQNSAIGGIFNSFTDAPEGFSEEMKEMIWSFGSEVNLNNTLQLRTGYITQSGEKGFRNHVTFGLGMNWEGFNFDFAYQSPIIKNVSFDNDKVRKFSLSYMFGNTSGRSTQDPEKNESLSAR